MGNAADTNGHTAGFLDFVSTDTSTSGNGQVSRHSFAFQDGMANGRLARLTNSRDDGNRVNGKTSRPEKIRFSYPVICENTSAILKHLCEILQSGQLSNFSKYSRLLEDRLREMLGARHVFTVPNATTGLEILLSTLPEQSEVLLPSFTFPATAHAIIHANLRPHFVDIDPLTFTISLEDLEKKINARTSAILAVNILGNPCRIAELEAFAEKNKIKLFFDSAPAMGAKYQKRYLGARGDAEVFSMSVTKIVSAGEGGFISTNDDLLASRIECIRNYGYCPDRSDCPYFGFNGKLSEIHAVFALKSLERMEANIAKRRELAAYYKQLLGGLPGISFQAEATESETNYCNLAIRVDADQFSMGVPKICQRLAEENIEHKRYFYPPLHKTTAFHRFNGEALPQSEALAEQVLCLPMHPALSGDQIERVCNIFIALWKQQKYTRSNNLEHYDQHIEKVDQYQSANHKVLAA